MNHRRYLPKPEPLDRPPRNNEARLKNIYEAQFVFKDRNHFLRKTSKRKQQSPPKAKPYIQELNLAELKPSHRYQVDRESKEKRDNSMHAYLNSQNQQIKHRYQRQPVALTSRNREDVSTDRSEMFKIRRKSISGSLKKKMKQQNGQHFSANPVLPVELNYYEQARKLYKEGKISQALSLFEITLEKHPEMPQVHYHIALCYLNKHQYQQAYDHLITILDNFPKYHKKAVYLFASIAAKNLERIDKAITLLSQGISKYPEYIDLYVYRARLGEQNNEIEAALEDYERALKSRKDNAQLWLNYALCLKNANRSNQCLSALNSALYCQCPTHIKSKIFTERIKIYYNDKKLKECKKDLVKIEQIQSQNSELYLYKGLIQLLEKNKKGALLSFEKCIRINNCQEAVAGALVEIAKSKIQDRDFYSANYHICRAEHLQVSSTDISKFKLFAEGVVFLMKRKINEGVQNLNFLQANYELGPYFNKLFYLYRAFGYFMQNKHGLAIEDYKKAQLYTPKDKHVSYNQLIAEGIVKAQGKEYDKALDKFDEAQKVISQGDSPLKTEPFIYRAMTFAEKTSNLGSKDDLQTLEQIFIALKQLDKAYDINDSNSNMLFLRSLIYMHLGKTDEGLQDIAKAISKSQQNVAKYFFFRALAHQTLGNTKQALNDFNICINLDQKYALAYLQRGKLLFSNQQAAKGLEDLKKHKELDPSSDFKAHECALFYLGKQFDLAQNCLPLINDPQTKRKYEIWVHFKQLRISEAKHKMTSPADLMICDIMLGQWSTSDAPFEELQFFSKMEYFTYMGIKYFNLGQYEQAINQFSIAIKEKTLMDLDENNQLQVEDQYEGEEQQDPPVECQTKANELHYLHYNLFLSYLANNQSKKAYQIFIRDILPAKEHFLRSQTVGNFSRLLFQTMKIKQGEDKNDKEVFEFQLFRSMLGESADTVDIQLPNFILRTRLCYLMPFAKQIYTQYSAKINPSFMLEFIRISEVQNRPEPPWVKRQNQDLVFTDEVINIDVEFQTTEHDEQSEADEDDLQGDDQDEQGGQESGSEVPQSRQDEPFDPRKFKQKMRLGDDLERKLQKIMANKNNNNDQ